MSESVNIAEMKRRVDGDEEIIRELFQIFLAEIPRMAGQIRTAVAEGDADRLMSAAHSLKGSAANLAADRVARLAADLEAMGRSGDLSRVAIVHPEIEAEIEQLTGQLTTILAGGMLAA